MVFCCCCCDEHQEDRQVVGVRGIVQLHTRDRSEPEIRDERHVAGPGTDHRARYIPDRVHVRLPQVPVLAHVPAAVRLRRPAGRFRGGRLRAVPENLFRRQRHVPEPVPGQAGLVLDVAVDAVVRRGHRQGVLPQFPARHLQTRRPSGGGHVLLVLLDHVVQPARGVLRRLFQRQGPNAVGVPVHRPLVAAVRHIRSRFHTHLRHTGDDQRGQADRRLGQDPGRAAEGGERAQGRQEGGDHVQQPERRRAEIAEKRLRSGDALRSGAVHRHHRVRVHLGANAHHHHGVLPLHARKAAGRLGGHGYVVRDVQALVRVVLPAAVARRRVL